MAQTFPSLTVGYHTNGRLRHCFDALLHRPALRPVTRNWHLLSRAAIVIINNFIRGYQPLPSQVLLDWQLVRLLLCGQDTQSDIVVKSVW